MSTKQKPVSIQAQSIHVDGGIVRRMVALAKTALKAMRTSTDSIREMFDLLSNQCGGIERVTPAIRRAYLEPVRKAVLEGVPDADQKSVANTFNALCSRTAANMGLPMGERKAGGKTAKGAKSKTVKSGDDKAHIPTTKEGLLEVYDHCIKALAAMKYPAAALRNSLENAYIQARKVA